MKLLRPIFGGCVLFALLPLAAHANPMFVATFDPSVFTGDQVSAVADITNTGTTTITGFGGVGFAGGTLDRYVTNYDTGGGLVPAPGAPALYLGINLAAGATEKFTLFSLNTIPLIYIPNGTYSIVTVPFLTLSDSTGYTREPIADPPVLVVGYASPIPEPSSYLLVGTGIVGAAGAVRRRIRAV